MGNSGDRTDDSSSSKNPAEALFVTGGALDQFSELPDPLLDHNLSNYRVERLIARGGMGTVYYARRQDGQFDRPVAIKVLHNIGDEKATRRFEQERSILASLNHPNIAQLFDAGVDRDARLYLVMEYVDGLPIDEHCASKQCGLRETIELVLQLCGALAFAHGNLVLHRDIKPSNVFVTDDGVLKLLDFGIAKLVETDAELTQGELPMTPSFASPEQLTGNNITVASDVFQTGVLLYRLLIGQPLFHETSLSGRLKQIVDNQTPKFDRAVQQRLGSDLCAVLSACLALDPQARYATISDLQADLRRYLTGYPVNVAATSRFRAVAKFLRRNRSSSLITGALILALVGSSTWYTLSLSVSEQRAQREARVSTQIKDVLTNLLESSDPDVTQGKTLSVVEVVKQGVADLQQANIDDPEVRVQLLITLARMLETLGASKDALTVIEPARDLASLAFGPNAALTWEATSVAASAYSSLGDYEQAEQLYNKLVESSATPNYFGRPRALALNGLAVTYLRQGKYQRAVEYSERATAHAIDTLGDASNVTLTTESSLSNAYTSAGQPEKSIELLTRTIPIAERVNGPKGKLTLSMIQNMAVAHYQLANVDEALKYLLTGRQRIREIYGPDHPNTIREDVNVGIVYTDTGRYDEGVTLIQEGIDKHATQLGVEHPMTIRYRTNLLTAHLSNNQFDQAVSDCERLLPLVLKVHGAAHLYGLEARRDCALARYKAEDGRFAKIELIEEINAVLDEMKATFGDNYTFAKELEALMQQEGIKRS